MNLEASIENVRNYLETFINEFGFKRSVSERGAFPRMLYYANRGNLVFNINFWIDGDGF